MSRYMVTGGAGVIGTRLVAKLRAQGHEVMVMDRRMASTDDELGADVTRFEEVWQAFGDRPVDCVIHLAGEVGRMVGEHHPTRMAYVNLVGTMNLIQLCLKNHAKFVLFSTSEVYGDHGDRPMCEELEATVPFKPTNVYALSKMFAEKVTRHYSENYGLQSIIIRPFMVYGPGEVPGRYRSALSNFVHKSIRGETLAVHRGTSRSWTFVDDFIDGVLAACEKGDFKRCAAYNIGRDEPRETEDVARTIVRLVGNPKTKLDLQDPPSQFISRVKVGCFCKAERELGFVAKTTLEEGVAQTIAWQRKNIVGEPAG